ncbi:MAG: hypothetical protein LBF85_03950 [Tannerella sp.]|nr:hypothetical protein [Tannerella sp.]
MRGTKRHGNPASVHPQSADNATVTTFTSGRTGRFFTPITTVWMRITNVMRFNTVVMRSVRGRKMTCPDCFTPSAMTNMPLLSAMAASGVIAGNEAG